MGVSERHAHFHRLGCWLFRAGCSDYAEGPEILCTTKNEDEPLGPAGTNIINVTATCSGPDSKINSDHLDVKIDGQAYGWDKSVAIRAGITDTKTGQFANVFSEYGQPGQQTKINIDLHIFIHPGSVTVSLHTYSCSTKSDS